MSLFVDTSVWSLFLRRDHPADLPEVRSLVRALEGAERVVTSGIVLQELLQGFKGPKAREQIVARFGAFALLVPDREDHIAAADLHMRCRQRGVQAGTIDALLAQLCVRHELTLLTADRDFAWIAEQCPLRLWRGQ